jgi:hypothetical protein
MTYDTTTQEGLKSRLAQIVRDYTKQGNLRALVRLIGGSVEDFDEKYEPSYGGSHPDERLEK